MSESRAAIRYAKAALEYALESKATNAVESDMRYILEALESNPELQDLLSSPVYNSEEKRDVLMSVFEQAEDITKRLIALLIKNKRISFLGEVATKYIFLNDQLKGEKVAEITTAVPLTSNLEEEILSRVEGLTGNKVVVENIIDENIIGGFVLRIGDMQFNASIANHLNNLKREFTNS